MNQVQSLIAEISAASNRYGDLLLDLMDSAGVMSLREITEPSALAYYQKHQQKIQTRLSTNVEQKDKEEYHV